MALHNQSADSQFRISGFTAIEITIVVAILAALFSIGIPTGMDFYYTYQFDSEIDTFISVLEQSRNYSMINRYESSYGVYISSNDFVIFKGVGYALRDASQDKVFPRNSFINISGPQEIIFSPLSGEAASSTFSFSLNQKNFNVYVNSQGTIVF